MKPRSTDPPINGNGARQSAESETKNLGKDYRAHSLSASPPFEWNSREDSLILLSIRTLAHAEHEFGHESLTFAVSAAEWYYRDLLIWSRCPVEFARQACWEHIGMALDWIRYLRSKEEKAA
jgi:hypothetical protein